ncbi:MAG: hypothetical protein ACMG6E_04405 [Candidatus Roizmanbacteria bacterium]
MSHLSSIKEPQSYKNSTNTTINKSLSISNSINNSISNTNGELNGISRPTSSTSTHNNMKKPVVQMKGMKSLQIEIPEEAAHTH